MIGGLAEYKNGMYVTGDVKLMSLTAPPAGTTVYMVVQDTAGQLYRVAVA